MTIKTAKIKGISTLKYYELDSVTPPHKVYLRQTEARMLQLKQHHLISQEYVLPIPYLCQIYHLLNLKHLELVHKLTLTGLKVGKVSQLTTTTTGGSLKFQTTLNPSLNLLKIWRKPIVEVELTLHTPYTIELTIPIYNGRQIAIIFNVLPLGDRLHKLFIDIYSDFGFPKLILQSILHCASYLTLSEDLPYLHKLADGNIQHKFKSTSVSNHEKMQLFKRFVDLYGSSFEQPQSLGAIELRPLAKISD